MPSTSKAQQRLMAAAERGASFPAAKQLRQSMTHQQLHDFASGPMKNKPEHAASPHRHRMAGSHDGLYVTEHHRGRKK